MKRKNYLKAQLIFIILLAITLLFTGIIMMMVTINDSRSNKQYNIVMFGNSITSGGNWKILLGRSDVLNKGYSGYTSSHLIRMVEESVIVHKPKICFIMVGINDILIGDPIDRIKINYTDILKKITNDSITPVVQSVLYLVNNPQSKTLIDSVNSFLLNYCNTHKIKYLDLNNILGNAQGLKPENSIDGLHLSQRAYKLWASEIKTVLNTIEVESADFP